MKKIIIHCSATPEGREHTVKDIDTWHRQRGFAQIGYHYVINLKGEILQGRPLTLAGAHTVGHNTDSIGICYIGGMSKDMKLPKDTRTYEQKEALMRLLRELKKQYPKAQIFGHRDFANKACPSFDAKKEYANL